MNEKNEIIVLYKNKVSIKEIVKRTGTARNTVRKYVRQYDQLLENLNKETDIFKISMLQEQICTKPIRKSSKGFTTKFTIDIKERFNELVEIDKQRDIDLGRNKQKITAALIYRTLIDEGHQISYSTILQKFNLYKEKKLECYIKQSYDYGKRVEYDFHEIKVRILNERNIYEVKVYYLATMSLPKSNFIYGKLYKNQNMKTVIESIIDFIEFSGGCPVEIVFDNMSTVVKRFILNGEKQYTDDICKLSNYYGFNIKTCNPRSGNEKGHVENSGKIIRNNLYSIIYNFESEISLFKYHDKKMEHKNLKSLKEFEIEKKHLLEIPLHRYMYNVARTSTVNSYSLISYNNNFYSIPDDYVGKVVTVNEINGVISIFYMEIHLCTHEIKKGFKEYSIDIMHYLKTFLKKPGALENSLAMKQVPAELHRVFIEDYNMNAKKFIEDLINIDKKVKIDIDDNCLEDVSKNQLEKISNMFDQI
ncbi:MAG: hypothetical protein R3Y64_10940 [Peptostreptococcaceae bacterium]